MAGTALVALAVIVVIGTLLLRSLCRHLLLLQRERVRVPRPAHCVGVQDVDGTWYAAGDCKFSWGRCAIVAGVLLARRCQADVEHGFFLLAPVAALCVTDDFHPSVVDDSRHLCHSQPCALRLRGT